MMSTTITLVTWYDPQLTRIDSSVVGRASVRQTLSDNLGNAFNVVLNHRKIEREVVDRNGPPWPLQNINPGIHVDGEYGAPLPSRVPSTVTVTVLWIPTSDDDLIELSKQGLNLQHDSIFPFAFFSWCLALRELVVMGDVSNDDDESNNSKRADRNVLLSYLKSRGASTLAGEVITSSRILTAMVEEASFPLADALFLATKLSKEGSMVNTISRTAAPLTGELSFMSALKTAANKFLPLAFKRIAKAAGWVGVALMIADFLGIGPFSGDNDDTAPKRTESQPPVTDEQAIETIGLLSKDKFHVATSPEPGDDETPSPSRDAQGGASTQSASYLDLIP